MQRDAVGVLLFEDRITEYLPARYRPGHLRRLMAALEREPTGKATDLVQPLEEIAATVRKRGLIVLISDLLAPTESLQTRLGYLRSRGHDVVVLRVLDPAEVDFPFNSPAMFHDVESGREIYIDPTAATKIICGGSPRMLPRSSDRAWTWASSTRRSRQTDRSSWFCLTFCEPECGAGVDRAAGSARRGEALDELPHALLYSGCCGRGRADHLSLDPSSAQRRCSVQLAHVSIADSSASDAAQPAGQLAVVALARGALVFLALAFARPFLARRLSWISATSKRRIALLVDTSASIAAATCGRGRKLSRARCSMTAGRPIKWRSMPLTRPAGRCSAFANRQPAILPSDFPSPDLHWIASHQAARDQSRSGAGRYRVCNRRGGRSKRENRPDAPARHHDQRFVAGVPSRRAR